MDGQKSKWDTIKFPIGLVFGFLIAYLFCNWKFEKQFEQIEKQYEELTEMKDSLLNEIEKHNAQISVLEDSLKQKKEKIVYIKIKRHEKMDSVQHLPLDEAMDFFSKSISSEIGD